MIWVIGFLAMIWTPHVVSNKPVLAAQTFESRFQPPADVAGVLKRACYNCHANTTEWPWYSHIWPLSSKIQYDVEQGRKALNFSEWIPQMRGDANLESRTLDTSCSLMQAGMMPPSYYLYVHPGSRLSNDDVRLFCNWVRQERPKLLSAHP